MHPAAVSLPLCLLWLIAIVVMDLRLRKVRNWMVLLGLGVGMLVLAVDMQPFAVSPAKALLGMLAAFAALLPFYALRWMGAGDVKFAAVIGLWFGLSPLLLAIWIGGSLLAGAHGVLVLAWHRLRATSTGLWLQAHLPFGAAGAPEAPALFAGRAAIQRSVPYAGYMAVAAIWLVLAGEAVPGR
ncbi:A24 family peptidase [Comamonas endophytica]|uniref:A24 family peptidase n=1 Tax=Comamonas endophytica TaxID=2949090 RepID=A0ABY6GA72_9BURK|nr:MULTISPECIES: A24 family peptidase [unclassified Acidovorax]MCD2512147.1 A24 family peptidase [Acidovorax sp. D4N7]UYG51920.1 A24 family peptidase [Acidovorax sp. 5MLIR]